MFRKFSKKELLKPSTTRFAYSFIVLSNLLDDRVYSGLRTMVVSEEWCQWKGPKTQQVEVVSIIWCTRRMIEEINKIQGINNMLLDEIRALCMDRCKMLHSPLHAIGYLLHPIW